MIKQLSSFVGVGVIASSIHYILLVTLVEVGGLEPVPSALCGFTVGGIVSYGLNRRHTFVSARPHDEAAWRFGLVASVAFVLTYCFMRFFHEIGHLPYLAAQVVTTGIVMVWTFGANRLWTFPSDRIDPNTSGGEIGAGKIASGKVGSGKIGCSKTTGFEATDLEATDLEATDVETPVT